MFAAAPWLRPSRRFDFDGKVVGLARDGLVPDIVAALPVARNPGAVHKVAVAKVRLRFINRDSPDGFPECSP